MTGSAIARLRLQSQRLGRERLHGPEDVVRHLLAVQAQDVVGATWGLGARTTTTTHATVARAVDTGAILRTHVLRPTWHFVLPDDIHWLLALTAPRVHQVNAPQYRRMELDARTLARGQDVMGQALADRGPLTREELADALRAAGIEAAGLRLAYVVMAAELDGVIASGPRRGTRFTYALLAERAPRARRLAREEALAELTGRYFASRGPATVHDLAKWSGLTVTDARRGLEAVRDRLVYTRVEGVDYVAGPPSAPTPRPASTAHLLSVFDEYVSSYRGHGAIADPGMGRHLRGLGNALTHIALVDGRVVGTWKRTIDARGLGVHLTTLAALPDRHARALGREAARYGEFLGVPARVEWLSR